jgi:hypothetical protein
MLSTKRIAALERKFSLPTNKSDSKIIIPEKWVDFAQLTDIRSSGTVAKFDPYDYQKELVRLLSERSAIICKSRQTGVSETIISFLLWKACRNPGYLAAVYSKTQTDSSLLARRVRRMITSLGLKTTTDNVGDVEIEGGGRLLFRPSGINSGRGIESVCDVFLDECGFMEHAQQVLQSIAPAMAMVDDSKIFIVSTPNGRSGFYYDVLNQSNGQIDVEAECQAITTHKSKPFKHWVDEDGYAKCLIHWKAVPKYRNNPNFLEDIRKSKKLTQSQIDQEYQLSFTSSDTNVFEYASVMAIVNGEFEKTRDSKATYWAGLDIAWMGTDATVLIVLKELNGVYSVVHLYRAKKRTSEVNLFNISKVIETYAPFKNFSVESNNGGNFYLESLVNSFPNQKFEAIKTTEQSKISMIQRLVLAIESKVLQVPDSIIINELLNFRKTDDNKLQAASGSNDDCVMALAFALQTSGFSRNTEDIFGKLDFNELLVD